MITYLTKKYSALNAHLTDLLIRSGFSSGPYYYVIEHPRSGGTWLGKMIAEYFDISHPDIFLRPETGHALIHGHYTYRRGRKNVVYVYRDGRDVLISSFYYVLNRMGNSDGDKSISYSLQKQFPLLAHGVKSNEQKRHLLLHFFDEWAERPLGCKQGWGEHLESWLERDGVIYVSYEQLIASTEAVLADVLSKLSETEADSERIEKIVKLHSFKNQTGRDVGQQDWRSNKRKGIVGDWKNHFDNALAKRFSDKYGANLKAAGYETNEDWVATCK